MTNVLLDDILRVIPTYQVWGDIAACKRTCSALHINSKLVTSGALFVAIRGATHNGEDYIPAAIKQGAIAVLAHGDVCAEFQVEFPTILFIGVDDVRATLSRIIKVFFPHQPNHVVAVTGTNGKTSVTEFARQIWTKLGFRAASLGTIGCTIDGVLCEGALTTPDPIKLHETLEILAQQSVGYLAMEASSHGLDQHRLHGVELAAVGFTNLSRDHLDYHKTMGDYFAAKKRLFTDFPGAVPVLNADISEFSALRDLCHDKPLITYGKAGKDLQIDYVKAVADGLETAIHADGVIYHINLPLVGRFQLSNVLCAVGLVWACCPGKIKDIMAVLPTLQSVPGRMEYIASYNDARIYVDFAHTPDALETALKALRHHTENHLHVLFGCGGNRDQGKRSEMGAIASKMADEIIVSDDNPRFEDPEVIRQEIIRACPGAQNIGGRAKAILMSIKALGPGDSLLIAGKGHESGQKIGDTVIPFQDRLEVFNCLEKLK